MSPRPSTKLVHDDDAIALVRSWAAGSRTPATIIAAVPSHGQRVLEALQVTTRSPLGAVALHTGGILIDHGWLRVVGSGSAEVPRALDEWNGLDGIRRCDAGLLVADDAIGGFFAWFDAPRTIHYLAPNTFEWEDLGLGYTDWLAWCFSDQLPVFYCDLRWDGWQAEVAHLPADRALQVYPPLFAAGGADSTSALSRASSSRASI